MQKTRVLIIDDEKQNVRYLTTILEENGFSEIYEAFDGEEGLQKVEEVHPGLILLDLRMPKKGGIHVFNELKESEANKDIPVVILTGEGGFLKHLAELRSYHEDMEGLEGKPTEEVLQRFITSTPDAFLEKPIEPEALMRVIERILVTVQDVRKRRYAEITKLLKEKLHQGIVFKGNPFSSDEESRNLLDALATRLLIPGAQLPADFIWRSSDNRNIPMSKEDVLAFHAAMTGWVYDLYRTSWEHKAALDKTEMVAEAEQYNIQEGWPGNRIQ